MKRIQLPIVVLIFFLASSSQDVFSSDTEYTPQNEDTNLLIAFDDVKESSPESTYPDYEVPEWVKRTNIAVQAGTDIKPKYFIETIQPLFGTQHKDTVLFTQARVSGRDYRNIYNLGIGARRIFNNDLLLGTNVFYDYQDYHQHHRSGFGFEAMADRGLEARLNTYIKVSNIRTIEESAGGQNFEEVAHGLDYEFGGPLPYLNFLKLYGGGYWYAFESFDDMYGWKVRAQIEPVKYSRLVLEMFDDNKRNQFDYRFEGAFTLALTSFHPRDILSDLMEVKKEAFPKIDLREKTLNRVVRDFDITVISTTKTKAGLTVEAGRA